MASCMHIQISILMIAMVSCGMSASFPAVILPALANHGVHLSSVQVSVVGSIRQAGIIIGSIVIGPFLDNSGRRRGTLVSILPAIAGYSIISISNSVLALCVGLLLSGIAMGMVNISAGVFLAEALNKRWRKVMSVGRTVFVSLGLTLTYVLGLIIKDNIQAISTIALVLPSLSFLTGLCLFKETAVWAAESRANSSRDNTFGSTYVKFWKALRSRPDVYKPFAILNFLNFLRHCTGTGVVTNYAISIIADTGATSDPYIIAVILGTFRTGGSLLGAVLSSFFRRTVILVVSGLMMTISMVGVSLIQFVEGSPKFAPEVLLNIFMTAATLFLAVSLSLQSEVYPTEFRGMCSSSSMMFSNLQATIVLFTYPILNSWMGSGCVMMLYAVSCAGCVLVAYFMVPNTDNKTLEEIGQMFQKKKPNEGGVKSEELLPLQSEKVPSMVKTVSSQKESEDPI